MRRALAAIARAGLAHLRANKAGVRVGGDPEPLHQMRVALRRLRSAIGIFSRRVARSALAPARRDLKWLGACMGPARDWDVFTTQTLPVLLRAKGGTALAALAAPIARARRAAQRRACRALHSARYDRLEATLARLGDSSYPLPARRQTRGLGEPLAPFAVSVLERRRRQVLERGAGIRRLRADELHKLRIAVKKYRYAMGYFRAVRGAGASRAVEVRLARLQDILGAMNDAAGAARLAGPLLEELPSGEARAIRLLLEHWQRRRRAMLEEALRGAWRAFRVDACS